MPFRYIHMSVFGVYTCPQIRLSACLNRQFSMFADDCAVQKSIASDTRNLKHQRGYINSTQSFTLGASSKAWARKRTYGRTRRTRRITSTTATVASRAPQSTASTALPQAFTPTPSQQFKPFHSLSSLIVLKVVIVRKVGRDRFLNFAIVCKHAKLPI